MKSIVVANDGADLGSPYARPFKTFAPIAGVELLLDHPEDVLCVVFTGGEDVDPSFYGSDANRKTFSNIARDKEERFYFNEAAKHHIPMAGICRGAQFLCVMNGGRLIQHVTNHSCSHAIKTSRGDTVNVTSTHHQMAFPPEDAQVLAWAEPRLSKRYEGADGELLNPEFEYEGVLYPQTRSLGMQWHPEVMREGTPGHAYTQFLIAQLLGKQ